MEPNELSKWCYNCDYEAVVFVKWINASGEEECTSMCRTCADAFELGQSIPDGSVEDIKGMKDWRL